MSGLKPAKQPRLIGQSVVTRTESVDMTQTSSAVHQPTEEGKDHPTTSQTPAPNEVMRKTAPMHPKGHKVRDLKEVWDAMDKQAFLHLTDSLILGDVWVQPKSCEPATGGYVLVNFIQMIDAPKLKSREALSKMSIDDLLKLLYLASCLVKDLNGDARLSYDAWLADKTAAFIKKEGVSEAGNRGKLCNFILVDDPDFSFYPVGLNHTGIFARKICYHSYRCEDDDMTKYENPGMLKCCATRGKFEYVFEVRLFVLPPEWFHDPELPATQPLD